MKKPRTTGMPAKKRAPNAAAAENVVSDTEAEKKPPKHYIREWRKHRDMTIYDLAKKVDMTGSTIAQIERNYSRYTQRTLEAIAEALQVETWKLLAYPPASEEAFLDALRGGPREGLFKDVPTNMKPIVEEIHRRMNEMVNIASIDVAKQMVPILKKVTKMDGHHR